MANQGTVRADIANAYEQKYHQYCADWVKKADPVAADIYAGAKRKNIAVGGENNNVVWARDLRHGVTDGPLSEGGGLGRGDSDEVGRYTLSPVRWRFTVEWTGLSEEALSSSDAIDRTRWRKVAQRKMEHIAEVVQKTTARWMMHDGTPIWGQVTAVNTSGDDYFEIDDAVPFEFYEKGQIINGYDAASGGTPQLTTGGVDADHSQRIQEVDPENRRVYVASVAGLAVGDHIALTSHYDQTVPNGLMNLIAATGTVQNVNRATIGNEDAKAWVIGNGGDPVTSDFIDSIRDRAKTAATQRGQGWKGKWYISPLTRRLMAQACIGMNRFTDMEKFRLGTSKVAVATEEGWAEFETSAYIRDYQILAFDARSLVTCAPEGKEGGYAAKVAGDPIIRRFEDGEAMDSFTSTWIWTGNNGAEGNFHALARGNNFV